MFLCPMWPPNPTWLWCHRAEPRPGVPRVRNQGLASHTRNKTRSPRQRIKNPRWPIAVFCVVVPMFRLLDHAIPMCLRASSPLRPASPVAGAGPGPPRPAAQSLSKISNFYCF